MLKIQLIILITCFKIVYNFSILFQQIDYILNSIDSIFYNTDNKTNLVNCIDPSNFELEQQFYNYQYDLLKNEQTEYQKMLSNEYIILKKILNSTVSLNCSKDRVLKGKQSRLFCSFNESIEDRKNIFPFIKLSKKCDCKYCSSAFEHLLKRSYQCFTVYEMEPVLIRGDCSSNGYFQWIPTVEFVEKGCTCGHNLKLIAF